MTKTDTAGINEQRAIKLTPSISGIFKKQRQLTKHKLTTGIVVVLTALTLIENIVVRGEEVASFQHFRSRGASHLPS